MNANDPLVPQAYVRFGIAAGIVLALLAGAIGVANFGLSVLRGWQRDAASAARHASLEAQAEADRRTAAQHARWLDDTALVTVNNESTEAVALWTATPSGSHADGSAIWSFNSACTAYPGQSCSSQVYSHRGIIVTAHAGPYASDATWHWQVVPDAGLSLTAHNLR